MLFPTAHLFLPAGNRPSSSRGAARTAVGMQACTSAGEPRRTHHAGAARRVTKPAAARSCVLRGSLRSRLRMRTLVDLRFRVRTMERLLPARILLDPRHPVSAPPLRSGAARDDEGEGRPDFRHRASSPPSSSRNGVRAKRRTAYPGSMPRRPSPRFGTGRGTSRRPRDPAPAVPFCTVPPDGLRRGMDPGSAPPLRSGTARDDEAYGPREEHPCTRPAFPSASSSRNDIRAQRRRRDPCLAGDAPLRCRSAPPPHRSFTVSIATKVEVCATWGRAEMRSPSTRR